MRSWDLEREVERLLSEKREELHYTFRRGKVVFERSVRRWQRRQRTGLWRFLRQAPLACILSAPIIYGMVMPLIILDLSITLFQHLCSRVYGIPRVRRGDDLLIDRHRTGLVAWGWLGAAVSRAMTGVFGAIRF